VLAERGIPARLAAAYEFGYAPPGGTTLTVHLLSCGYTNEQILASGVGMTSRRGTVLDRFRDRLMLPIREPGGERIVGFLGRALGLLRAAGAWPTTAALPDGQDPAGLLAGRGPQALRAALDAAAAAPLADLVVDEQLGRGMDLGSVEGRVAAARDLARLIATF